MLVSTLCCDPVNYLVIIYTVIAGVLVTTAFDFIVCAVPLAVLMYITGRPRPVDVFVFTDEHGAVAEAFIEQVLEYDPDYDTARIMLVNADKLIDSDDDGA